MPARGLIGVPYEFLTETRGTASPTTCSPATSRGSGAARPRDRLAVADRSGVATSFAMFNLQERWPLFVDLVPPSTRNDRRRARPRRRPGRQHLQGEEADEHPLVSGEDLERLVPPRRPLAGQSWSSAGTTSAFEVTPDTVRLRPWCCRRVDLENCHGPGPSAGQQPSLPAGQRSAARCTPTGRRDDHHRRHHGQVRRRRRACGLVTCTRGEERDHPARARLPRADRTPRWRRTVARADWAIDALGPVEQHFLDELPPARHRGPGTGTPDAGTPETLAAGLLLAGRFGLAAAPLPGWSASCARRSPSATTRNGGTATPTTCRRTG